MENKEEMSMSTFKIACIEKNGRTHTSRIREYEKMIRRMRRENMRAEKAARYAVQEEEANWRLDTLGYMEYLSNRTDKNGAGYDEIQAARAETDDKSAWAKQCKKLLHKANRRRKDDLAGTTYYKDSRYSLSWS